jgi:hypothetical protein
MLRVLDRRLFEHGHGLRVPVARSQWLARSLPPSPTSVALVRARPSPSLSCRCIISDCRRISSDCSCNCFCNGSVRRSSFWIFSASDGLDDGRE